jgi:ribonuclease D
MNQINPAKQYLVDGDGAAREFFAHMPKSEPLGLDTEFMRTRTYYPKLCLLQVSTPENRRACIDPLTVDTGVLKDALARIDGEFVIHAAGQDLEVLKESLGFLPSKLFDTQIAAALLGRGEQVSYAALVSSILGVELVKGQTRTDWCRRPLSDAQIHYAFEDVEYLLPLRNEFIEELDRGGKLGWMEQACRELLSQQRDATDESMIARFKGGSAVPLHRQALLRRLLLWREEQARKVDRPREWIISSADLINIARDAPTGRKRLESIPGTNPAHLRKYADALLEIVSSEKETALEEPIWQPRGELSPEQRDRLKTLQARVRAIGAEMSISPAILASRADLEALLSGRPCRLDTGWRRDILGGALKEVA